MKIKSKITTLICSTLLLFATSTTIQAEDRPELPEGLEGIVKQFLDNLDTEHLKQALHTNRCVEYRVWYAVRRTTFQYKQN